MRARAEDNVVSWGRVQRSRHWVCEPSWRASIADAVEATVDAGGSTLAYGLGRSYGDSALNADGGLVRTAGLDRVIAFDREKGVLRAESGMSIDAVLRLTVPAGWFVPVTPGTKFVTLAGAVANDVHGKNHHVAGTFGRHVTTLGLWRSDRGAITCSPSEESELFGLTIGGLGLTGFITWVEVQLIPIRSTLMEVETRRFSGLDGFFDISEQSGDWPYTVAWIDSLAGGPDLGRGVFSRGRPSETGGLVPHAASGPRIPVDAPEALLNRVTIGAFNTLYRARPGAAFRGRQHYDPFFYPLDRLQGWNRLYGGRGFYQWQCVVPRNDMRAVVHELLTRVSGSGEPSFLAVLKVFGDLPSPGRLSFPMPGATLALDFPNRGSQTLSVLEALDQVVSEAGGRLYAAKDGRLPGAMFRAGYPDWHDLETARDPVLQSDFWRRVTTEV